MLITQMFLVVSINRGLFPVSLFHLMSMCAGGSLARQTAKLANGNIPYHKRRAQFMNGFGQGEKAIGSSQFP